MKTFITRTLAVIVVVAIIATALPMYASLAYMGARDELAVEYQQAGESKANGEAVSYGKAGVTPMLTPSYTPSSPYRSSKYYTQLCNVSLTGNQRTDLVNVVKSQLGYHEGDSFSDLGGGSSGSSNYTEYGYWYGTQVAGSSGGYYYSWCAYFISWCARQAGISTSIISNASYACAGNAAGDFKNLTFYPRGSYTPRAGDLIFFDWEGDSTTWDHVEVVTAVSGSSVTTIGGNTGTNNVKERTWSLSYSEIKGYGVPNYSGSTPDPTPSPSTGSVQNLNNPKNPNCYPTPPSGTYLNVGDSGNYVKWLQACLNQSGHTCDVDGQFGYGTAEALKAFQRGYGLTVDGGFGPECRAKILQVLTVATPSVSTAYDTNGTKVTISCSTSGVTIFYTTNGSNPTESSNKYTGPFVLSGAATVKAIAMKDCRFNSGVCTKGITVTKHTVTFKDWNGTTLKTQSVYHTGSATAPANPSREGYTFTGWDKSFTNVTSDLTVTAQYSINSYTVTFNDWDGTVLKTQSVNYGGSATAPANPSREGYTFTGWDKPFTNVASNLIVTAQYSINSYTVTFKDWDGTVLKTQSVNYGGSATAPADPSREGYNFIGWSRDFSNVTEDIIVTAMYEAAATPAPTPTEIPANAPRIVVDSKTACAGGTVTISIGLANNPGIASMTLRIGYDDQLELINVEDTGLLPGQLHSSTFANPYALVWANDLVTENYTVNGSIATLTFRIPEGTETGEYPITASYSLENYDIYDCNGEVVEFVVVNGKINVTDIVYGDVNGDGNVNNLDRLILSRHLANWSDYPASMIKPGADVNADSNINNLDRLILTRHLANWPEYATLPWSSQASLTIPASPKEAIASEADASIVVGNVEAAPGDTVSVDIDLVNNPGLISMTLYLSFDQSLTLTGVEDTGLLPGKLHAAALTNPYTLAWANDLAMEDYTVNGTVVTLVFKVADDAAPGTYPINIAYDYDAYDIYNCNVEPVLFAIESGSVTVGSSQPQMHTVTFVDYDGTVLNSQQVEHGMGAIAPDDPTRTGYTFTGWDTDFSNVQGDLTVTAQYAINSYTITYTINGEEYAVQTYAYGAAVTAPEYIAPEGYTFSGWNVPETMPAEDIVLDAALTVNSYTITYTINGEEYAVQTYVYGAAVTAPEYTVPEGHTFSGWNVPETMPAEDLVLDAACMINVYDVTLIDGVTGEVISVLRVEYGQNVTLPDAPTHVGYIFDHWEGDCANITENRTIIADYLMIGDANVDGEITLCDALLIMRYALGLCTEGNEPVMDFDGNGVISSTDALLVLRRSLNAE